jgi:hypothetical protein
VLYRFSESYQYIFILKSYSVQSFQRLMSRWCLAGAGLCGDMSKREMEMEVGGGGRGSVPVL